MSLKSIFTILLILVVNVAFSAPASPPGGGGHPACWPYCVPIDKGLVFLIIAAGLYGGKKLYDYQKELKTRA
ncbi:MAG: PID-CTERM protein-sorting domain-containing protein [Bacteroidia bacterium]